MDSTWAGHLVKQDMGGGVHFHGGVSLEQSEDGSGHLLQIARRIVDYRDIHRDLGTVILSFDQEVLWEVISSKTESRLYICEGDQIIASEIREDIGKKISEISTSGISVLSTDNAVTGWKLYDYYSMREFSRLISHQTTLMMVMTVGFLIEGSIAVCLIFKPIFLQVKQIESAMIEVEKGDFSVRVPGNTKLPREVVTIVGGFNKMVEKTGDLIEKLKTSAEEQRNAELSAMEAQIDPHFLYNTLDTMKWVAKANHIPEIAKLAAKLAKIGRTSISSAQFITLQEEMTLVESYAKIQKIRFNGKFDFRYEIAPETEEILVPKLIVQPIVENAVIHGLADADEGHIFVRAYLERKELVIEVSDDGCGISDEVIRRLGNRDKEQKNGHIGFYNVDTIIRLHYGKDYGLRAERLAAGGTKVTIRIPVNGYGQPDPGMENRS